MTRPIHPANGLTADAVIKRHASSAAALRCIETERAIAAFAAQIGRCCAGCDWWDPLNSVVGECTLTAPVPGPARGAMLGIIGCSARIEAGHIVTPRGHDCGEWRPVQQPQKS